ncbi:MAG: hypothetical protein NC311_07690 [Muribaculaceae bacterium]|nr:hypothetical protein [Muribaculaceae bacterium]
MGESIKPIVSKINLCKIITTMTQQEINTSIHAQLKAAALGLFEQFKDKVYPGNYTAKEIYDEFNKLDLGDHMEGITLTAATFRLTILLNDVFRVLQMWETSFIKKADHITFIREDEKQTTASCTIDFPNETRYIVDYAATDTIRPQMCGVLIDFRNSRMVASDTRILNVTPVAVSNVEGDIKNIIVDTKTMKELAGQKCKLELLDSDAGNIRITTQEGRKFVTTAIEGTFPAYERVIPNINRDGLVEFSKDGIKTLTKFVKMSIKQAKDKRDGSGIARIIIEIPAYSSTGTASFFNHDTNTTQECKFNLVGSPRINVCFGVHAWHLGAVLKNWDGCLWFNSSFSTIVFDNTNTDCTLIFPMNADFKIEEQSCTPLVDAFHRRGSDYDTELSRSKQPAPKAEPALDYTETIKAVCNLMESVNAAMSELAKGIREISLLAVTNILDALEEPIKALGNLLDMIDKFNAFTNAADAAGVEVKFDTATGSENQHIKPGIVSDTETTQPEVMENPCTEPQIIVIDRPNATKQVTMLVEDKTPTQGVCGCHAADKGEVAKIVDAEQDVSLVADPAFGPPGVPDSDRPPKRIV